MSKLTGAGLAKHCKTKIGTPYVYGAKGANGVLTNTKLNNLIKKYKDIFTNAYIAKARKFVGKVCTDCSGLISWYTGKNIGSYQMYSSASKRGLIATVDQAPVGAVLWKKGHVGVKISKNYCIEGKGIDYGTVKTKISEVGYTHWLLFSYLDYAKTTAATTAKQKNPYSEPGKTVYLGCKGDDVRWVQWELCEAGFDIKIDGDFGQLTQTAVKTFQQSSKLTVTGKVTSSTRKAFLLDQ